MAELNDWTCEYNGLVMGEPDSAISIVHADGLLELPDIRSADLTMVQRHGLYPGDDYMNGRAVTVTLEVYGSTREEFTQALNELQAAFLPCGAEKAFRFRFPGVANGETAYVMARPRKRSAPLNLDFANMVCNIVVELYSTSPYIYGDTLHERTLANGETWTFEITGSVPALPVIAVHDTDGPLIKDEITGAQFGVDFATMELTIDSEAQTVQAGTDHAPELHISPGSTWPEYAFGEHRVMYSSFPISGSPGPTTATVSFRERWA